MIKLRLRVVLVRHSLHTDNDQNRRGGEIGQEVSAELPFLHFFLVPLSTRGGA